MPGDIDFLTALAAGYNECGCSAEGDGLVLAVSGGADSMALLHGTIALYPRHLERIAVAHVDHQLRGNQSTADAEFVRDSAKQLGVRHFGLTADVIEERDAHGGTIEEVARRLRYRLLQETAETIGFGAVVCAHHQDDQAETVLHNIIRGTGLRGLQGMQCRRPLGTDVQLVRPMLKLRRYDTKKYLADAQLPHQTDVSNQQLKFTRNRTREVLLPILKSEFNPAVEIKLISLAAQAEQAITVLDSLAERILSDVVLDRQPHVCRLDKTKLAAWPRDVVRHVLSVLWIWQEWPRKKMTHRHYERLASAILASTESREDLPGGIRFHASAQVLLLIYE